MPPGLLPAVNCLTEEGCQQQVRQIRLFREGCRNIVQEPGANNASTTPDSRNLAIIEVVFVFVAGGSKQVSEILDMPGIGRFTTLTDPAGAAFALITPATDTPD